MSRPSPLNDICIIDLTQVFAGPYCTYQLALLGAKVIKIEPPGGEQTRTNGAVTELNDKFLGLAFCTQNADKYCLEIDLKTPEGLNSVLELVSKADVFVQNFRPGVASRLGLGEDAIRKIKNSIIYCSISAYGSDGPIGGRAAYDHVVQAMSGIMSTTGTDDIGPLKVGAPYIDYGTGLNAAFGILAALRERDRTGEGQTLDVSMLDTALNLMANNLVTTATTGNDLPKLGNEAASRSPSSGCFLTSDGTLLALAANTERQFKLLCKGIGHPQILDDPRWSEPKEREKHQKELNEKLKEIFSENTSEEWELCLQDIGVPASQVRSISEVLTEGQPDSRGLLAPLKIENTNIEIKLPAIGFQLNGNSLKPRNAPKRIGHDNTEFLEEN